MPNEGGFIYGQDDNPNAKPSKDKVVGKVDLPEGDMQQSQDNCNIAEGTGEYSDKVKDWECDE